MLPTEVPAFIEASIPIWWNRERLLFIVYNESEGEIGSFYDLGSARKCWENYCIWLSRED